MVWFSGGRGARPIRCLRDRRWFCGWEGGGDRYVRFEIFYDFNDVIAQRCAEYRFIIFLYYTHISRPSVYRDIFMFMIVL